MFQMDDGRLDQKLCRLDILLDNLGSSFTSLGLQVNDSAQKLMRRLAQSQQKDPLL